MSVLTGLWWCVCRVNDLLLKVNNLDTTNTERRHAEQALRKHSRALTLVRTEFLTTFSWGSGHLFVSNETLVSFSSWTL